MTKLIVVLVVVVLALLLGWYTTWMFGGLVAVVALLAVGAWWAFGPKPDVHGDSLPDARSNGNSGPGLWSLFFLAVFVLALFTWGPGKAWYQWGKEKLLHQEVAKVTVTIPSPPPPVPVADPPPPIDPPAVSVTLELPAPVETMVVETTEVEVPPPPAAKLVTVAHTTSSSPVPKPVAKPRPARSAKPAQTDPSCEWKYFGAAPYAPSRDVAMQKRREAFKLLGLPAPVIDLLMKETEKSGKAILISNGDRISAQMSKGGVVRNCGGKGLTVAFVDPPIKGMGYNAKAEEWQVTWEGKTYVVALPEICNNWSLMPSPTVPAIKPPASCYIIPQNYRNTPGVVWDEKHRARVSVHFNVASKADFEQFFNHPCTGVGDADGFRKPFPHCAFWCETGQYPEARLAVAVGLPPEAPNATMSYHLKDGEGYFSMPKEAIDLLFCILVNDYDIVVYGYEGWTAVTRFDFVTKDEIGRTLPQGRLDRTLSGAQHY